MGKVLVIDDHEVEAMGRAAAFVLSGHEARSVGWAAAAAGDADDDGAPPELLLAVVRRDISSWDRYRALVEAGDLSRLVAPGGRVVAAMAEPFPPPVTLVLRLAAHGVTEVAPIAGIATVDSLDRLVSSGAAPCRPSPIDNALAGLGAGSDPEAVIAYLEERTLGLPAVRTAFQPGLPRNRSGVSRRQALTIRRRVCELGRLIASGAQDMGGPVRDTSLARWSQVVDFVNECRGFRPDDELIAEAGCDALVSASGGGAA